MGKPKWESLSGRALVGISHFSRRSQKYEMSLDATGGSGTLLDPTNAKLKGWTGPLMDMSGVIFMGSPMFDHDDMRATFRPRLLTMVRHAMGTSMGTRVLNCTTHNGRLSLEAGLCHVAAANTVLWSGHRAACGMHHMS